MVPIIITATGLRTLNSSRARPYRLRPGPPSSTRGMSTDLVALAPIGTWELTPGEDAALAGPPRCRQCERAGAPPGPLR